MIRRCMRFAAVLLLCSLLVPAAAGTALPAGPNAGPSAGQGAARAALLREAERALAAGPFSVMDKQRVPPSGDKHDFLASRRTGGPTLRSRTACPTSAATAR